jgi:hypothetical protein
MLAVPVCPYRGAHSRELLAGKDADPGVPRIGCNKSACSVFSRVTRRPKTLANRCYVGD